MAEVGTAFVTLAASAKGFGKSMESQIGPEIDGAGKKAGSRFGTALKVGATAVLAGAALGAKFLSDAVGEAREGQKVAALTAQVIKTTGSAAGVTAKQVGDLATAISNKTGIDDEAIQSGSNLLLTFKNIRNEAGAGNDIFNQTTRAVTDMSVAMGQDMKSSAIQVGKALNDPIKGVTALTRVGVTFTDSQKEQIKTLVESGRTMDAQKVILKELNSQFGGAAAASSTAGDKFKTTFGNFKEAIGTALLPAIDTALQKGTQFLGWMTENLVPAIQRGWSVLKERLGPAFDAVKQAVTSALSAFGGEGGGGIMGAFKTAWAFVSERLTPIFRQYADIIRNQVVPIVQKVAAFFVQDLVPAVMKVWQSVGEKLKPVLTTLVDVVKTSVMPTVSKLLTKFEEYWPTIKRVIEVVVNVTGKVLEFAAAILGKVLPPVIRFAGFLFEKVVPAIADVIGVVVRIIAKVIDFGQAVVNAVQKVAEFVSGLKQKFGDAVDFVRGIPDKIKNALGDVGSKLFGAGRDLIQGMIDGVRDMAGSIAQAAGDVVGSAIDAAKRKLGIKSPSTVFRVIGHQTGEGLRIGIADTHSSVQREMRRLVLPTAATMARPSVSVDSLAPGGDLGAKLDRVAAILERMPKAYQLGMRKGAH